MRIVHVAPLLPGTAADFPAAVRELAAAQAKSNSGKVQVVAAARDAGQTRLRDLELRAFVAKRPRCLGRSRTLRHHLANCPLELVHAHCLGERGLHYAHVAAQRHGAPLVISPAGTLGLGGGDRFRLRCAFQRFVVHAQALEQAAGWHATSAEEAAAIRACGFKQPICVAPFGAVVPAPATLAAARAAWIRRFPTLDGRPVALCLAEDAPASRLRALLTLWASLSTANWLLLIVAPSAAVTATLTAVVAKHGLANRVCIAPAGDTPPHAVARLFLAIGRTPGEPDPVATALAAGLPALVTAELPWSRLATDRAGWCVPWPEFGRTLARALDAPPAVLDELGHNASELATREFTWPRAAELLLAFYRNLRR